MTEAVVFLVDDDADLRDSMAWLLRPLGIEVRAYASAAEFLAAYDANCVGCLVTDVRMPGMSGLELQELLARRGAVLPVIVITGHGDVPMTVRAMRGGALDVIEKPFNNHVLIDRIQEALRLAAARHAEAGRIGAVRERFLAMTPREREIALRVAGGAQNKAIAHELGISLKTVEIHRHNAMEKMAASTGADLARLLAEAGLLRTIG